MKLRCSLRTTTRAAVVVGLFVSACGGNHSVPSGPTVSTPIPTPTPVPTPTPLIDDFVIVDAEPPSGGVIHTGTPPYGMTTAFKVTLSVVSAADREANIQVFLEGPSNGVCLEDAGDPSVDMKAGVPVTVTIAKWWVTSVCGYPNHVTRLTARMMPSPDPFATPIREKSFVVEYTVMQ